MYTGLFNFKLNSAAGGRTWPIWAFRCWQGRNDGNVKVRIKHVLSPLATGFSKISALLSVFLLLWDFFTSNR